MKKILKIYLLM